MQRAGTYLSLGDSARPCRNPGNERLQRPPPGWPEAAELRGLEAEDPQPATHPQGTLPRSCPAPTGGDPQPPPLAPRPWGRASVDPPWAALGGPGVGCGERVPPHFPAPQRRPQSRRPSSGPGSPWLPPKAAGWAVISIPADLSPAPHLAFLSCL